MEHNSGERMDADEVPYLLGTGQCTQQPELLGNPYIDVSLRTKRLGYLLTYFSGLVLSSLEHRMPAVTTDW